MADYFASQRPPLPAPSVPDVSDEILAKGKALVTQGAPKEGVPHAQAATALVHRNGASNSWPAGLRAKYISAQLGAWRYGTRTAAAPDCMQIVAGHLTENDVIAIAAWLSSLPAPADLSPALHGSLPMPLTCGSEPN